MLVSAECIFWDIFIKSIDEKLQNIQSKKMAKVTLEVAPFDLWFTFLMHSASSRVMLPDLTVCMVFVLLFVTPFNIYMSCS